MLYEIGARCTGSRRGGRRFQTCSRRLVRAKLDAPQKPRVRNCCRADLLEASGYLATAEAGSTTRRSLASIALDRIVTRSAPERYHSKTASKPRNGSSITRRRSPLPKAGSIFTTQFVPRRLIQPALATRRRPGGRGHRCPFGHPKAAMIDLCNAIFARLRAEREVGKKQGRKSRCSRWRLQSCLIRAAPGPMN